MGAGCRDGGGLAFPDNAAPSASPHGHPRHRRRCRAMGLVERADQRAARARRLRQRVRAMPSLHVGWALWSGWFLFRHARRKTLRGFGLAYPALTTLVVIATGNHYLADAIAGAFLTLLVGAVVGLVHNVGEHAIGPTTRLGPVTPADRPEHSRTDLGRPLNSTPEASP
ncbi:phosphatase PAP2 family protein [Streptomyces sp. RPA4-2]|uniref:phosphatase PAP2 family protein n=3 Tax=unclassified Streptomyces TaxID=2593676 RepID=UPI0032B43A0D